MECLPSSQFSVDSLFPFPHVEVHVSTVDAVPPVHNHPFSTRHPESHPSPDKTFPSSHASPEFLTPLPQVVKAIELTILVLTIRQCVAIVKRIS